VPSEAPTPLPTTPPGTRQPKVLANPRCSAVGGYAIGGNTIYASCVTDGGAGLTEIRAFNATTGAAIATYSVPVAGVEAVSTIEADNGIWYTAEPPGACVWPCPVWTPQVAKMNPSTKRVVFTLSGWSLAGHGLGFIWATRTQSGSVQALAKIDPVTNQTLQIPFAFAEVEVACGSLWGLTHTLDPVTTTLTRVDPTTGAILDSFTEPAQVHGLTETPQGCWATEAGGRFVRVGDSGIEERSPVLRGMPTFLADSFWMHWSDGFETWDYLQRLDPITWQPSGAIYSIKLRVGGTYSYHADYAGAFAAGNSVWAVTATAQVGDDYWRLDIPLAPLPAPASPSPTAGPTAEATDTPAPAPSA
jgi:hypothetical protein